MTKSIKYKTFLSHNSLDKGYVRALEGWLKQHGISCFLDDQVLLPGDVLTDRLSEAMDQSESAVICIGPQGEGPWQREEVNSLLNRAIKLSQEKDEFRLIPVLFPGADRSKLRWFMDTRLWVDLKNGITDDEAPLHQIKRAILGEHSAEGRTTETKNPYQGLDAFDVENADSFFGRAKRSQELAQMLRDWRFAAIVGPSGNGKSSLARAGLVTEAVHQGGYLPGLRESLAPSKDGTVGAAQNSASKELPHWERLVVKPGRDLLGALLTQLYAGAPAEERGDKVAAARKRIFPEPSKTTPKEWAVNLDAELRLFFPEERRRLLLLVDQFEEIFTHAPSTGVTEEKRQTEIRFQLEALAHFRGLADKRWHVVLTLRSDFLDRCRASEAFWQMLEKDHLKITLDELDEEGWRSAIKGPAERAGAYLEAGLVEKMLEDVYRQRGSMPLLQVALQSLWKECSGRCLTHAVYTQMGGVDKTLQGRAEASLEKLEKEEKLQWDIARNLFIRLTTPGEGVSDSRRRMDLAELKWAGVDADKVEHVKNVLSDPENRLIVADGEALEVTHEVLITDCPTIQEWIENVRGEIPKLRRLTHAARQWDADPLNLALLTTADPLKQLQNWQKTTTLWLTQLEKRFLRRCVQYSWLKSAGVWFLILFLAVAASIAYSMMGTAKQVAILAKANEQRAQEALSKTYFRIIGRSEKLSNIEIETLWELAETPKSHERVRQLLMDSWFNQNPEFPFHNHGAGMNAALGLGTQRSDTSKWASAIERYLDHTVTDESRFREKLQMAFDRLTKEQQLNIIQKSLYYLVQTSFDKYVSSPDENRLASLIAQTHDELGNTPLIDMATRLGRQFRSASYVDSMKISRPLALTLDKIPPAEASAISDSLTSYLEPLIPTVYCSRPTKHSRVPALAETVANVSSKTPSASSSTLIQKTLSHIVETLAYPNASTDYDLPYLLLSLKQLSANPNFPLQNDILLKSLHRSINDEKQPDRTPYLIEAFSILSGETHSDDTAQMAENIAQFVTPQLDDLSIYDDRFSKIHPKTPSELLLLLSAQLPEQTVFDGSLKLADGMKRHASSELYFLYRNTSILISLLDHVKASQAAELSRSMIGTLEAEVERITNRGEPSDLAFFVNSIIKLTTIAASQSDLITQKLSTRLPSLASSSPTKYLHEIAESSMALSAIFPPQKTKNLNTKVTLDILSRHDLPSLTSYPKCTHALLHLATDGPAPINNPSLTEFLLQQVTQSRTSSTLPKQETFFPPNKALLRQACVTLDTPHLVNTLKTPFCSGPLLSAVLEALEEKTGQKFNGDVWQFVDYVEKEQKEGRMKEIDLSAPVRRITLEEVRKSLNLPESPDVSVEKQ
ncbi:toll/interleukin-1 receptor domain-containing protein [Verrucomicrobium sp. BvORR106]|uniref:toll/interleukin-1 receptor domain-containing protein n=1 Tax=Verrucomicrobium sp. BvORR106 TaxID=1403819 RepID=UPI000570CA46|nr:toll/interleukin-1 receptor domain-containing protein [Verrucomicrobium sp. BvORR106]